MQALTFRTDGNSGATTAPTRTAEQNDIAAEQAFLDEFNSGKRDWHTLPCCDEPGAIVDYQAPVPFLSLVESSDAVVIVTAVRMRFVAEYRFPTTKVTYHVERTLKGELKPGDEFELDVGGGPMLRDGREVMIGGRYSCFDRPGGSPSRYEAIPATAFVALRSEAG